MLNTAGIEVTHRDLRHFTIEGPQPYLSGERCIPGDWPGAAAILAAAAVTDSDVTLSNLSDDAQGERAIVDVLRTMGADVTFDATSRQVHIRGGRPSKQSNSTVTKPRTPSWLWWLPPALLKVRPAL